jgi:hypothetical protein
MPTRENELVPDGEIQKASLSPLTSHLPYSSIVLFLILDVVEKPLS